MPSIIDYSLVKRHMTSRRIVCNYPNSGSFGFAPSVQTTIRAWTGPEDSTIKPSLLPLVRHVPQPYEINLASAAIRVWQNILPGPIWLLPTSHWHYELQDGCKDWLADLLTQLQLDPNMLDTRADGSAIEFGAAETKPLETFLLAILRQKFSDFLLAFGDWAVLCTVHHHQQLWWVSSDADLMDHIDHGLSA
jgi:hypothetical protein